jgi:hypothetical protein
VQNHKKAAGSEAILIICEYSHAFFPTVYCTLSALRMICVLPYVNVFAMFVVGTAVGF